MNTALANELQGCLDKVQIAGGNIIWMASEIKRLRQENQKLQQENDHLHELIISWEDSV